MRVLGEISLTTKLSKRIALTDGFTVAYDRTPPDGIRSYDTQLKLGPARDVLARPGVVLQGSVR